MTEKLEVEIGAEVNGTSETKQLADAVAQVGDALRDLIADAKSASSAVDKVERNIALASKSTRGAISGVNGLANAYKELGKAIPAGDFTKGQYTGSGGASKLASTGSTASASVGVISTAQSRAATEATEAARAASARVTAQYQKEKDVRRAAVEGMRAERLAREAAAKATQLQTDKITQQNSAFNQARPNIDEYHATLQQAGYGLTNVSFSLGVIGAAILASTGAAVKAAADYETAMAQISRTSGIGGAGLETLRGEFVELAQTIPASFGELSQIGTLAGQLNVPAEKIAAFTETTAKFSATTNVSAEAAATAFGRLDALLPDVKGNYEALGSSILTVGVNSVATESEIIATTSQIAAAGAQARFTADQVIGLAASYASLGVAPEAARGTTIRVFSEIRTAINQGGAALDEFAKLSDMSAEDFKKAWNRDAGATFIEILQGLQKEGSGAEDVLRGLGITAVRDINALLKLSQNAEVVADNFGYAGDGFSSATQLGAAFEVQAATLASKLEMLANSVQALFAELGQAGLGPLGGFVDLIKDAVIGLTELAENPIVQWTAALATGIAGLVGVAILLAAGLTRVTGGAIIARNAFLQISQASIAAGGGMRGFAVATLSAAGASQALKGALISTGIGALVVALGAAVAGIDALANAQEKAFGTGEDLAAALQADTAEYERTGERLGKVEGTIKTVTSTSKSWVAAIEEQTGGQVALNDAAIDTTETIKAQTFAIGSQTAALLANKLANSDVVKELFKQNDLVANAGIPTLNTQGVLAAGIAGDTAKAKAIIEEYRAYIKQLVASGDLSLEDSVKAESVARTAEQAIGGTTAALQDAANQTTINTAVTEGLAAATGGAATEMTGLEDETTGATSAIVDFGSEVTNAFSKSNAISAFAQDFSQLISDMRSQGSTAFDPWNESGQKNLQNLQSSIATSISAGQALGIDATESVAIVFKQLQQQGVDTAKLLASLGNLSIPGVSLTGVGDYLKGTKSFSDAGGDLNGTLGQIAANANKTAGGLKKVGGAAAAAAKQVYTLVDYASDLGSVFSRSFDLRFGNTQALDTITTGWRDIADASLDAAEAVQKAKAELAQLTGDKAVQEYFLSVANAYGDNLRAGVIGGKLADINAKIAAAQRDLVEAQNASNKSLTGNSAAAIANRETLLGMVSTYQEYLQQLASSGASQAELAAKAKKLKAEFIAQAVALGYNKNEVKKYAKAFDDMGIVINKLPRKVTIDANINPALQALREFESKAKKSGSAAGTNYGQSFANAWVTAYNRAENARIRKEIERLSRIKGVSAEGLGRKIQALKDQLIPGYSQGGYTGGSSTSKVAGYVHGKEFVVNAAATAQPGVRAMLTALNNGARIGSVARSSGAGGGTGIMELGPKSLGVLREAIGREVELYLDPTGIARLSDKGHANMAYNGA